MSYGKNQHKYIYPNWATALGWCLSLLPLSFIPAFAIYRICNNTRSNKVYQRFLSIVILFKNWRQLFISRAGWCPAHEIDQHRSDLPTSPPTKDTYRIYNTELNHFATTKYADIDTESELRNQN
jgi:hypothetical protein